MARPNRLTRQAPPPRQRISPLPLVLAAMVVVGIVAALAVGVGNGSSSPADTGGAGCQHWCGSGTATVSYGGSSAAISGGGCYDAGPAGLQANFGDWQGLQGVSDYLSLVIFLPGRPSPTPDENGQPPTIVTGSINGDPFLLGPDVVIGYTADGTGSFSGTDVNGGGEATGTFTCR